MRHVLRFLLLLLLASPAHAANWYVDSVGYAAVPQWAATHVYSVGNYVRQLAAPSVGNERVWKATSCSGTCTSGGSEPAWTLTANSNTTDNAGANQIVWNEVTGKESEQASNAWAAPAARINGFPGSRIAAGDSIFLGQDHAETQSSALNFASSAGTLSPVYIFCVNRGVGSSVPPVSADLTTGCSASTTGASNITVGSTGSNLYVRGVTFNIGSGNNTGSLTGSALAALVCDTCTFNIVATGSLSIMGPGGASSNFARTVWKDTKISFGATGQSMQPVLAFFEWYNTNNYGGGSNVTGTPPTILFGNSFTGYHFMHSLDLSGVTGTLLSTLLQGTQAHFWYCKLASGVTLPGSGLGGFASVAIDACDNTTNNKVWNFFRDGYPTGVGDEAIVSDSTIYRVGGASDGTTPISWKATMASGAPGIPLATSLPTIAKRITTTGSPITITVALLQKSTTQLTNAQVWLDVEALATSGAPLSTTYDNRVADLLNNTSATNLTADTTSTWTGATARANSHAYTSGDMISVSSNTRLFVCSGSGTSSGSLPAGYASAVDGGTVSDGSATFTAMYRKQLQVTVTPQVKGYLKATVRSNYGGVNTFWVDPKIQ